jgi:hypothetical protein
MRLLIQGGGEATVAVDRLVIGGWSGRDAAAVRHHIDELAEIGVPAPSATPLFYRVACDLLTQADRIEALGEDSSGEAEAVLIGTEAGTLVAVGSDHTDRKVEAYSVPVAKQMCAKAVSREAWRIDDLLGHWDEIALECDIEESGVTRPYQRGTLAAVRRPEDMVARATGGAGTLPTGTVLFLGTIPVIGGVRAGAAFTLRLSDPVLGRVLEHRYAVASLPVVT